MEDEERSHRGESIGRAGDQCAAEKETEMKKKKSRVCYDVLQPEVMIYFSKFREVSLFFILGNFNNMLLI